MEPDHNAIKEKLEDSDYIASLAVIAKCGQAYVYRIDYYSGTTNNGIIKAYYRREYIGTSPLKVYLNEVKVCSYLSQSLRQSEPHPCIVKYIGCGPPHMMFLRLETVEGVGLDDYMDTIPPTDNELDIAVIISRQGRKFEMNFHRLFVMLQMICALEYIHKRGIVHRDINPSNFMLIRKRHTNGCWYYHVKLLDFGYSRFVLDSENTYGSKGACDPLYSPPERLYNVDITNHTAVDIYHLGMILFNIINNCVLRCPQRTLFGHTDRTITTNDHQYMITVAHLVKLGVPMIDIAPDYLQRIVSNMLNDNPDRRWCAFTTRQAMHVYGVKKTPLTDCQSEVIEEFMTKHQSIIDDLELDRSTNQLT